MTFLRSHDPVAVLSASHVLQFDDDADEECKPDEDSEESSEESEEEQPTTEPGSSEDD